MAEGSTSSLSQKLAKLLASADEFNKRPPSRSGLSPPWISSYKFLTDRMDCFIIVLKDHRDALITPCAKKVLDAFNSKNSTDYEVVDCLDVCCSANHGVFFHCNFTAKPKSLPFVAGDYSAKVFFAEIQNDANGEKVPTSYSILQGVNTKLGCGMCLDVIAHPTSGPHEELIFRQRSPYCIRKN